MDLILRIEVMKLLHKTLVEIIVVDIIREVMKFISRNNDNRERNILITKAKHHLRENSVLLIKNHQDKISVKRKNLNKKKLLLMRN